MGPCYGLAPKPAHFSRANCAAHGDMVPGRRGKGLAMRESLLQIGKVDKDSVFVEVETGPQPFQKRRVKTGLSDGINVEIPADVRKQVR